MEFLYPAFLTALIALSVPIIIHLFNLKKFKKVYFPNVSLLKAIEFETKSQSRLRHLLILLSRLLALLFLIFAFAQPFIPATQEKASDFTSNRKLSVYVDNSFSMAALKEDRSLFDEAKRYARVIAEEAEVSASFQLITNDFKASEENYLNKEQFLKEIDQLTLSPNFKTISEVTIRMVEISNYSAEEKARAYIISDFQEAILDVSNFPVDSNISFYFLPTEASQNNNIYIDSVWFDSPIRQFGTMENLSVRIVNEANENFEGIPVKLYVNEIQKTPAIIDLPSNSSKTILLSYVNNNYGTQNGKVVIRDYPVSFDDAFFFNYTVDSLINILVINGFEENETLNKIYHSDGFNYVNQDQKKVDYSVFNKMDLIILNELNNPGSGLLQEIKRFLGTGGNIVVIPSENPESDNYNQMAGELGIPAIVGKDTSKTTVDGINTNNKIYKNVFDEMPRNANLPAIKMHFNYQNKKLVTHEDLLPLKSGGSLLKVLYPSIGSVYTFSTPIKEAYGNFTKHSLIVPTFYNIALFSLNERKLYYTIGNDNSIELPSNGETESIYHLKNDLTDIIPETQVIGNNYSLFLHNQMRVAGNVQLFAEGSVDTSAIAFNYNRRESSLNALSADELTDFIQENNLNNTELINESNDTNLASIVSFTNRGKPLWKYCIILALVFIFTEMMLTKLWK